MRIDNWKNYLSYGLLSLFGLKLLVLGTTAPDMGLAIALTALVAVQEVLDKHKRMKQVEETTNKKLEEMKSVIEKQNIVIAEAVKKFDELKSSMTGLKMQFGVKPESKKFG